MKTQIDSFAIEVTSRVEPVYSIEPFVAVARIDERDLPRTRTAMESVTVYRARIFGRLGNCVGVGPTYESAIADAMRLWADVVSPKDHSERAHDFEAATKSFYSTHLMPHQLAPVTGSEHHAKAIMKWREIHSDGANTAGARLQADRELLLALRSLRVVL